MKMKDKDKEKLSKIIEIIGQYGMIGGGHNKQWILTKVLKIALGEEFKKWLKEYNSYIDEDGENYDEWDLGIIP